MSRPKSVRDAILEALREHPFLSRRQLELYLHASSAGVRYGLRELRKRQWIWQTNARQPGMRARALYAPTRAGIQELARQARVPYRDYVAQTRVSPDRLNRLVVTMERVFQLRTLFLWLSGPKSKRATSKTISRKRSDPGTSKKVAANIASASFGPWQAATWDVEVGKLFSAKGNAVWIPFHGAAVLERRPERSPSALLRVNDVVHGANPSAKSKDEGKLSERSESKRESKDVVLSSSKDMRWVFVVVEFDLNRAPVDGERERLVRFVAAQDDPRYWGKEKEQFFPVLVVVAQDELRLQAYYNLLRSAALARQLPMPRAYLTTVRALLSLRDDRTSPIWYSTISGQRTSLLFDTEGLPAPLSDQVPWRKMPLTDASGQRAKEERIDGMVREVSTLEKNVHAKKKNSENPETTQGLNELAQISLKLSPLAKRLLDEIASHPLLTRDDLTLLLKVSLRWVRPALAEMSQLKLIQVHQGRYLVAAKGQQYLTLVAGYGNAVRRYVRARGWGNGFDELLRHWEHTQEENKFFLQLAEVARKRRHRLTWLSELEGRLYYEAGQRWHSFLPDGRGTYGAGKKRYEFALEIDRSRAPLARFRGKLSEYDACLSSNVLRSEGIEFLRVLVVTHSWERADAWRRAALEVKTRVPVFITTFDRVEASGVDAPIWLRGDVASAEHATSSPKVCCFESFSEKAQ